MFSYESVKSIHQQKMAQFVSEREKDQLARQLRAGRPGSVERLVKAIGEGLKSADGWLGNRPIQPA